MFQRGLQSGHRAHFLTSSTPKGLPWCQYTVQKVPGEALVTISQPTSPLSAAKSPKVSENRAHSPYLREDEPPDKEEQDSRHDARKKG